MAYTRKDFEDRLAKGNQTEAYLLQKLIDAGINAQKPEVPEGMLTSWYTKNQIDIVANDRILEVKGRNLVFDGVANYPYPTLFVESVSGFDAKIQTPDFYISVSNPTGAVIALDVAATRNSWVIESITGRKRFYTYDMFIAAKELWMDWVPFLRRL